MCLEGKIILTPPQILTVSIYKTFLIIFTFLFSIHFKIKLMFSVPGVSSVLNKCSYSWTSYGYGEPLIHTPLFSGTSVFSVRLWNILYDRTVG